MLQFTKQYFTPDDVSVPCRASRCEILSHSTNCKEQNDTNEPEEITCTMRTWHKTSTPPPSTAIDTTSDLLQNAQSSSDRNDSPSRMDSDLVPTSSSGLPELVITPQYYIPAHKMSSSLSSPNIFATEMVPKPDGITRRKSSPSPLKGSQRCTPYGLNDRLSFGTSPLRERCNRNGPITRQRQRRQFTEKVVIPLSDIAVVHVNNENGKSPKMIQNNSKIFRKNSRRSSVAQNLEDQNNKRKIGITTTASNSNGPGWYYEFTMESMNEQLVLLTFLEVNSSSKTSAKWKTPKIEFVPLSAVTDHRQQQQQSALRDDRDEEHSHSHTAATSAVNAKSKGDNSSSNAHEDALRTIETNPSNLTQSTQQSNKSFDLEIFTAKRMKERLNRESITEKVERRMHRLTWSLEQLTNSLSKCTWGCIGDSTTITEPATSPMKSSSDSNQNSERNACSTPASSSSEDEGKGSTAYAPLNSGDHKNEKKTVPTADGKKLYSMSASSMKKKEHQKTLLEYAQIPSGLSVETPDSHSEYSSPGYTTAQRKPIPILGKPSNYS